MPSLRWSLLALPLSLAACVDETSAGRQIGLTAGTSASGGGADAVGGASGSGGQGVEVGGANVSGTAGAAAGSGAVGGAGGVTGGKGGAGPGGSEPGGDGGTQGGVSGASGEGGAGGDEGGVFCGGIAHVVCGANEYCDYPDASACGANDQTGICRTRPKTAVACPVAPASWVCGCNNVSYCTEDAAHSAGVDVRSYAPCTNGPTTCGGPNGTPCAADEYCDRHDDQCSAGTDEGTCLKKPSSCEQNCAPETACDCKGLRYCSICQAAALGIDTVPCELVAPGTSCTSPDGSDCGPDEYCSFPDQDVCGATTAGVCTKRPTVCSQVCQDNSCECGGKTECNACVSAASGLTAKPCE